MIEVDDEYQLIYKDNSGTKTIINEAFLNKLQENDYSGLPFITSVTLREMEFFKLVFNDGKELKIFKLYVECKLKDLMNPIKIFSLDHLKIILQKKINEKIYTKPYYYSNFSRKYIYIDLDKIEEAKIYLDNYIEIEDPEIKQNIPSIKSIFIELDSIYKEKDIKEYTYQFISPNFNSYLSNMKINLTDKFFLIYAFNRIRLKQKITQFLDKNDSSFIYPICGPHGTGKTISLLYFHKLFFQNGIRGLYLNLKYYLKEGISLKNKIDVLLKECFFICDNEQELSMLYDTFIKKINISELFISINEFIQLKNKKAEQKKENKKSMENKENKDDEKNRDNIESKENKGNESNKENKENEEKYNKIYLIIDQYQEAYNLGDWFDLFKNIKIILSSSINDFDVKRNLILKYEDEIQNGFNKIKDKITDEQNKIIKYHYIDDLININYFEFKIFQEQIKSKIIKNQTNNDEVNKEFEFIYSILKKLGFIPKYFFEYLYYYDSILDLLFNEYSNIMKKLTIFIINRIIDLNIIDELKQNNYIVKKDEINVVKNLSKNDFIKSINSIPLKYINFKACKNAEFYLYYSFPLFKKILNDFIQFEKDKKLFYTIEDGSERGKIFERILKYQFRVHKKFNIDGYFKVEDLINMKPTKKYANIKKEYFTSKNNIFIDQKKASGQDYDFAIYRPKSKQLLLFQAKYIINKGTVAKKKSLYDDTAKDVLTSFNNLTKENIGEVYLLFISSIYYNYDIRENVIDVLSKKRINCIFYSLKKDLFYFNFNDIIYNIELDNSYMLIPTSDIYKEQEAFNNKDFEKEEGIYKKYKDKEKKNLKEKSDDIKEEEEEKEMNIKKVKELVKPKNTLLLKRKRNRYEKDLKKMYDDVITYIKNNLNFNKKMIISLLGHFKTIESDDYEIDLDKEYAIILYLNEKSLNIDYNKKLGLIIYNDGVLYLIDLKENMIYKSYSEFLNKFQMNYLYVIGDKKL